MIYDFNQEILVDNKDKIKPEIENIIEYYKLNNNVYINEEDNYLIGYNYIKDKNSKIDKEYNNKLKLEYEKEKYFEQEIMNALEKKEDQKTINNFYKGAFFCFLLTLSMNIFELLYILSAYSKLIKNLKLIINSANLKYYHNYNIYFLRELSLCFMDFNITNGTYINFPSKNDKGSYSSEIYNVTNYIVLIYLFLKIQLIF